MRSVLLLVGGAFVAYSIYTICKNCKKKPVSVQPQPAAPKRVDIYTKTEFVAAPNPMIEHFDARPEVLFAPPMAYVYSGDPSVTDLIT